jgi:hypothetical protein
VLLVHGLHEQPTGPDGVWTSGTPSMEDAIAKIPGVTVVTPFDYYSTANSATNWVTAPSIGAALASDIICLAQASTANGGPGKVIIVAHSMGGLAVRCAVNPACVNTTNTGTPWPAASAKQIGLVVTLGTPNTGSTLADLISPPLNLSSMLVSAACKLISQCKQFASSLADSSATVADLQEGSAELDPNYPKPDPNLLAPLPASIPLYAIAGKITLTTTLFGSSPFDIPVGDIGDIAVPVNSALAEAQPSVAGSGSVSGSTTIDCGTIPIDDLDLWSAASGILHTGIPYLTCWHLTETTDPTWQADVVAAVQAAAAALSSAAQAAIPEFFVHNGYELGSLYKYPDFPTTIGLDNGDSISGLQWSKVSQSGAVAPGTLNHNTCTPACAAGNYVTYPVELLASDPEQCTVTVYQPYSDVSQQENSYIFNKIYINALEGQPPAYLVGNTPLLSPACG